MEKGIETHMSGFDTVVFACAKWTKSTLITNDRRFYHNVEEHNPELKAYFLRELEVNELK